MAFRWSSGGRYRSAQPGEHRHAYSRSRWKRCLDYGVQFFPDIPEGLEKGDLNVLSFGRFNLLDLIDERFFRFMNIAQIGPLTVLRQLPLITNGISFATVRGGHKLVANESVLSP
jgi:hypothetical protein